MLARETVSGRHSWRSGAIAFEADMTRRRLVLIIPKPTEPIRRNTTETQRQAFQIHVPGTAIDGSVGLGDVVTRLTGMAGLKPCGGCKQRAAVLNRWVTFTGRR